MKQPIKKEAEHGDIVFQRLSQGCPNQKDYHEGFKRCIATGKPCNAKNCGPYHWFTRR